MPGHFYTIDPAGGNGPARGFTGEGIACFVYKTQNERTVPFYRWYRAADNVYFYTLDRNGGGATQSGYKFEAVECYVFERQDQGSLPAIGLYQWVNPHAPGNHFYTTDPSGELASQLGLRREGIACYVLANQYINTIPLWRWR